MKPLINCQGLTFHVGDKHIINGINLTIMPHDFMMVLGGNGSGKSSLLKLLTRQYNATNGSITLAGKPLTQYSAKQLRQQVVTLNQSINDSLFRDLTVAENAVLIESTYAQIQGQAFNQRQFLAELPDYLATLNKKLPSLLNSLVSELSGGEQQILALALYLRAKPKLLLLDEHTSAMDPKKAHAVMEFVNQIISSQQIACIMTTHKLDDALNYGNRLIALDAGKVAFAANQESKANLDHAALLAHCYG